MQGEQTDPARHMNGILMGMAAMLGNFVRNIVDGDDAIKQHNRNKKKQPESKITEHGRLPVISITAQPWPQDAILAKALHLWCFTDPGHTPENVPH